jgi:hypothetical protein
MFFKSKKYVPLNAKDRYYSDGWFKSPDRLWFNYPWISSYAFNFNNPIRYNDPSGMGPIDRVKYARSMTGIEYPNPSETNSTLRTANTPEALKYMDCAEFVCRVMEKDGITDGVKHLASSSLKKFLDDKTKFEHSKDKPQVGDIAVWDGHVGIVTGVDENNNIKVTHARGVTKPSSENPGFTKPENYRPGFSFYGYYHPINETSDGKLNGHNKPAIQEITYGIYNLPEIIVSATGTTKISVNIKPITIND